MHEVGTFFKGPENEHSGSSSYWLITEPDGHDGKYGRVLCLYNRWRDELVNDVNYSRVSSKSTGAVVARLSPDKVPPVVKLALEEEAARMSVRPCFESHRLELVEQGWSLEGHWYVCLKTGAGGPHGYHIVCTDRDQSLRIAEVLKTLT